MEETSRPTLQMVSLWFVVATLRSSTSLEIDKMLDVNLDSWSLVGLGVSR